ncbi:MAG TPA: DUF4339 domain-containing protein [Phycisphaerae bacterium]|nr:DUF4339 domain-containing protein [Phycisphaerae bacterium]
MSDEIESYYVRIRGKVTGPFDRPTLERMVQRGQLSRVHEISSDRQNWKPASSVGGLFAPISRKTPAHTAESSVGIATPDLPGVPVPPDLSTFQCNSCGAVFPKNESHQLGGQELCTKCYERIAGPVPSAPPDAGGTNWMNILSKAREQQQSESDGSDSTESIEQPGASGGNLYSLADDGLPKTVRVEPLPVGLSVLITKPAVAIYEACQKLGPDKSIAVGLVCTLIFELSFPLAFRFNLLDLLRFIYIFNGETLHHLPVRTPDVVTAWIKIAAVATMPFIIFMLTMFVTRSLCRPGTRGAGDSLTAGAALAPFFLVGLSLGALGNAGTVVAVGFGLFSASLLVLTLFYGLKDLAGLQPRWAALVVPAAIIVAACVTKLLSMILFV